MPSNVLIVKIAAIGDVVMALPMIGALRANDSKAHITWLCGAAVAPLLRCIDGIDALAVIDDAVLLTGSRPRQMREVLAAWSQLRGRHYDLALIAHSDRRYQLLVAGVRARARRWLGAQGSRPGRVPCRYLGDEYVRLVTGDDDYRARLFPNPPMRVAVDPEVADRIAAIGGRPLVALAPGGARNAARDDPLRRWPLDRYVTLAAKLNDSGFAVALTGAASDDWVRAGFADTPVIDLIGATTLPGLVALYARCAVVVAHDSGPMHLARLSGSRVVALFGPTAPTMMISGADERVIPLWPGRALPCAPCYDGHNFADCADNRCLQMIAPLDVAIQVSALAAQGGAKSCEVG